MKIRISITSCIVLLLSLTACTPSPVTPAPEGMEARLRQQYAPDSRTDRVVMEVKDGTVTGYTTRRAAYDSVAALAAKKGLDNQMRFLPDTAVGDRTVGIIKVSVANLRSKPGHSQELATQALLGTPVQLLDFVNGWYLVRTPDRYLAWLEPGALAPVTAEQGKAWLESDLWVCPGWRSGEVRSAPGDRAGKLVTDLVSGNLVRSSASAVTGKYRRVELPDGVTGYVHEAVLVPAREILQPLSFSAPGVLRQAGELAGRPYLWGGTSAKGMDCSGFTKMAFYLNGFVIPRDASQQVHAGAEVELTDDLANLQPGDLLFFGRYRDDGSEKITHTGFYLGNGRFLHAGADNGRIQENSLIPGDEDFAEHRLKSLMRARRLAAGTGGVVPVGEAFGGVLE